MPKKPITADALSYAFREELSPLYSHGRSPAVAIVPVLERGWAALTSHRDRKRYPQLASQIEKIDKKLRLQYFLHD
jgi:hypothetical protein